MRAVRLLLVALAVTSCGGAAPKKDVVATTPAKAAAPAALSVDMKRLLDEHNARRKKHCAAPLAWSSEVAAVAQKWAERCKFEHSKGTYGENLAMGTTGSIPAERVISMWYDEISKYDFAKPGFGMATGHFTQVVWKGTTHVGCGSAQCDGMTLWVCNYDPPGNFLRRFEENVLPESCAQTSP